eukprot:TRINITY_DN4323_c0_g1_i1.p1 TRINITY_DN4323_c0_g1~~TRINITY_DN4323_c0_g1_i1.p1  ORF type:complete len:346 (+),score=22.68 TRINITY_DN4323_c0_g1_i1:169-1206(+)
MSKNHVDYATFGDWSHSGGNSKLLFGGRCISAKGGGTVSFTLILILAPTVLCSVFVMPFAIKHFTIAQPIIFGFLILHSLVSLVLTASTDPGLLPRNARLQAYYDSRDLVNNPENVVRPPERQYKLGQEMILMKFCNTCMLFRPPRSSHCSICDSCVEKFDHHCPWTGNCIGKRNYKFFTWFLFSTVLSILYVLGISVATMVVLMKSSPKSGPASFTDVLSHNPVSFGLALYTFLFFWSVAGLAGMHFQLICFGTTTNEQIKGLWKQSGNPYTRGCFNNWKRLFFGPGFPSLISPWDMLPISSSKRRKLPRRGKNEASTGQIPTSVTIAIDEEEAASRPLLHADV